MEIIEKVLGNRADAAWAARLRDASVDWLELSQWDAQKNRLRKETENGRSMAVALERGESLRDGDVLEWDENARSAVVCRIRLCPVMAVDLTGLAAFGVERAVSSAVRLGHALGNQHWPAVVKNGVVYVPMTADECRTLKDCAVSSFAEKSEKLKYKQKFEQADKNAKIWKDRFEKLNKDYEELKQKAQPFLDAIEIASEKVWAFINAILARGKELYEHKHPARNRGQDMEI